MNQNLLMHIPGISHEELMFVGEAAKGLTDEQEKNFIMIYSGRRKDPQMILILTLIGFVGAAGIQRFMLNQIGMGILYLLTGGLCVIGTIVDLINYQKMTFDFNKKMIVESVQMAQTI